jgi:hypothetical protein
MTSAGSVCRAANPGWRSVRGERNEPLHGKTQRYRRGGTGEEVWS